MESMPPRSSPEEVDLERGVEHGSAISRALFVSLVGFRFLSVADDERGEF